MKKTLIIALFLVFAVAGSAQAQANILPDPGVLPGSPFYFVKGIFEGVGTLFTFGNSAKAERYLALAEKRLAEAQALAERGDERAAAAVARYEEQAERAKERAERVFAQDLDGDGDLDILSRIADATTMHLSVLDDVYERVPEQAKASIQAAKERSMDGQIEALRGVAQKDPETAVRIFDRAVQARAGAFLKLGDIKGESTESSDGDGDGGGDIDAAIDYNSSRSNSAGRIGNDGDGQLDAALQEFEKYAEFGREISALAEGLQTGETSAEQLVERAMSHYRDVLRDVQSKVPPEAQESIRRELDKSTPLLMEARSGDATDSRPQQPQPQRSIPENSVEAVDLDDDNDGIPDEVEAAGRAPVDTVDIPVTPGTRDERQ